MSDEASDDENAWRIKPTNKEEYLRRYLRALFSGDISQYEAFLSTGGWAEIYRRVNSAIDSEATRALLMARHITETTLHTFTFYLGDEFLNAALVRWPPEAGDWINLSTTYSDTLVGVLHDGIEHHASYRSMHADVWALSASASAADLEEAIHRRALRFDPPDTLYPFETPEAHACDALGLALIRSVFDPTVAQAALFEPDNPAGAKERAAYARQTDMAGKLRFLNCYFSELTLTNIYRMLDQAPDMKLMAAIFASKDAEEPNRLLDLAEAFGRSLALALRGENGAILQALGVPSIFDEYGLEPPSPFVP